jgi:leader peptidase (prepilin peptidase)/N-methyltransferase
MTPDVSAPLLLAVCGLMCGSFLNVCIHRLPLRQSVVWPGSRCPHCARSLRWFENLPVLSYLALGGRCRGCRAPISIRYPLVELATMAAFLLTYWAIGWTPSLIPRLALSAALIVLFAIDLEHQILPNVITLPGVVVGLAFSFFLPPGWQSAVAGILIGGGLLWAIAAGWELVRGIEAMGFGDVKMLAMIGAFLGWKLTLLTFVLSTVAGGVLGAGLLLFGRGNMTTALPFGTFLALGALVSSLVGEHLLDWYLSLYCGG